MNETAREREQFGRFLADLARDPLTPAPHGLDNELAGFARAVVMAERDAMPATALGRADKTVQARVWRRVLAGERTSGLVVRWHGFAQGRPTSATRRQRLERRPNRGTRPALASGMSRFASAAALVLLLVAFAGALALVLPSVVQRRAGGTPVAAGQTPGVAKGSRLYLLSYLPRPDGNSGAVGGRVTVLDRATQQEVYVINAGMNIDAILSPDGSRLYIAGVDVSANGDPGGGRLIAVDAANGSELWRLPLQNRLMYIEGGGPSTLTLSPDGRRLYVYSYSGVPAWLQIVDTVTGQVSPDTIPLPDAHTCGGARFAVSRDGDTLYMTCTGSNDIRFINVRTRQVEQRLRVPGTPDYLYAWMPGSVAGAELSRDGRRLYIVTSTLRLVVVDVEQRAAVQDVAVGRLDYRAVPAGLVAFSADGTRLVVGLRTNVGRENADELRVFDTSTWREVSRLPTGQPLVGGSLALNSDGSVIYGIGYSFNGKLLPDVDTVLALSTTGDQARVLSARKGEEILRLFVGP